MPRGSDLLKSVHQAFVVEGSLTMRRPRPTYADRVREAEFVIRFHEIARECGDRAEVQRDTIPARRELESRTAAPVALRDWGSP